MKPLIYVILGATATGKTKLAVDLAKKVNGEVISADSMQVYKEMDIGTAKPTQSEMQGIAHYMIDICNPDYFYSVAEYQKKALDCIKRITENNKIPIIAGGSGLYINSLTYDLDFSKQSRDLKFRHSMEEKSNEELYRMLIIKDPDTASRIHPNNRIRILRALEIVQKGKCDNCNFDKPSEKYNFKIIGLKFERPILYERINERVDKMIKSGLEAEARHLFDKYGYTPTAFHGIGYKEFVSYFNGEYDYNTAVEKIKQHSRNLAKKQHTWFKRDKRIKWLELNNGNYTDADSLIEKIIN